MSRRLMASAVLAAAVIGALALAGATPGAGAQEAQEETLVSGWYRDREVKYYDFGDNTKLASPGIVQTAPIYVFIHGMNADGTPDFVEGQHNIVDVKPGDAGYSDLWQVMLVTVPANYQPDSIKSKADLDASGLPVTATQMFVNCPIVPEGTTLESGPALTQGWYKGEEVFYPDFGMNNRSAIPIWVFVTGFNADGSPNMLQGQNNIIDAVPGDAGYSAFWQVNFVEAPAGYVPNSIRSAADVRASGFKVTQMPVVVNCPVTTVSDVVQRSPQAPQAPGAPVAAPSTGTGGAAGDGDGNTLAIALAAAAGVAGLAGAGAGLAIVRRRAR